MKPTFLIYIGLFFVLLFSSCKGDEVRPMANIRVVNETGYNGELYVRTIVSASKQLVYTFENKNFGPREEALLEVPVPDEYPYNIRFVYYGYDSQHEGNIFKSVEKSIYVSAGTAQTIILSEK